MKAQIEGKQNKIQGGSQQFIHKKGEEGQRTHKSMRANTDEIRKLDKSLRVAAIGNFIGIK